MEQKFEVGDRVVRTANGKEEGDDWDAEVGDRGTIIATFSWYDDGRVLVRLDRLSNNGVWYGGNFIEEHLWDSPLYKALR